MVQVSTIFVVEKRYGPVEYWTKKDAQFFLRPVGLENREPHVLTMKKEATIVLQITSTRKVYLKAKKERRRHYSCTQLGNVPDCYIYRMYSEVSKCIRLDQALVETAFASFLSF